MNAPDFTFRELVAADAEALAACFERNDHPAVTATFDPFPLTRETAERIARRPRRDRYYGAFAADGELIGMTMLRGWDEGYEVPSFGMFVDRRLHHRGVGTRLTDHTIAAACALAAPAIRLSFYGSNSGPAAMYRSRGFREREREAIVRHGRPDTRIVLTLDLTGPPAVPLAGPALVGREREYVLDCLDTNWISSAGGYIERFEDAFRAVAGTRHAVACVNGTAAVHLALAGLAVGPGDEVIVPTLTYVASANPILYCGARPVLVDAERETWNLDPERVAAAITPRTKGILAVHLYGHPADMDALAALAREHGLWLLEDAAEAHGAGYRGRAVGSLADAATFSFYGNKVITTGEGGMVTTDDAQLAARMRQLRGQGSVPERRYWFPVVGFNYRMTNIAAAIGLAQTERFAWHRERRREIAGWYRTRLEGRAPVRFSPELPWARSAFWMSSVVLERGGAPERDAVMAFLAGRGIETRPFFQPMHTLPAFRTAGGARFPVADELAARGINLPSGALLEEQDVDDVCRALIDALR